MKKTVLKGRKNVEKKPSKEFVDILISNIEKIKDMNFDEYINFLSHHDLKLTKKEIFTNTRYILTGNNNSPSVKDLFLFFDYYKKQTEIHLAVKMFFSF